MTIDDRRLIEDYLPIKAISKEASREKSVRKGHISTLHLWWARRPLVACRAAVYGAMVPDDWLERYPGVKNRVLSYLQHVSDRVKANRHDLTNKDLSAEFVELLCKYPGYAECIEIAEEAILTAHAERLTRETGKQVTVEDVEEGRAPRPKVLDMFAGGGAIPLEALRLGCEAYALELNPVAHIIELCTLVYPQKYGKPDPNAKGMTGPKNDKAETTWGGLAEEVRYWGNWVLERVREEIGDLYPLIPDPESKPEDLVKDPQPRLFSDQKGQQKLKVPGGYLAPVAYLWTRTVQCKKPSCSATVPLARQTWLCKKKYKTGGRYIALRRRLDKKNNTVTFGVEKASSAAELGFDPSEGSRGGNVVCPFCQSPADATYVKAEGRHGRIRHQLMAVVCQPPSGKGKLYFSATPEWDEHGNNQALVERAEKTASKLGITLPEEPLEANPRSFDVQHFGFNRWRDVFTKRQLVAMTAFAGTVKRARAAMVANDYEPDRVKALSVCLSSVLGRLADYCTSFCTWQPEFIAHMYASPGLPMIMDFAEANPLANSSGGWSSALDYVTSVLDVVSCAGIAGHVDRGSALSLPYESETFDAVITDPPYYDSRTYSNLADHFYVWHKRAIGDLLQEHFASQLTPKKVEAIAAPYRHGGHRRRAAESYEEMMQRSFQEAFRVLKAGGPMICVYAHKTTAGWATLVNALRHSGFSVREAWPIEMERKVRQNAQKTAALASSIFLVACKRERNETGSYEAEVRPELERIVGERVNTLWQAGITGADLVIAAVGAGLQTFTRFERVEYANGEEVAAHRFLAEVETIVLGTILTKLSKEVTGNGGQLSLAGVDSSSRFYILWRYTYKYSVLDSGGAIIFANGTHVELDGPNGLSTGARALLEKKKGKYSLKDFSDRGSDKKLGQMMEDGQAAPMIDALHRTLWLMENRPGELPTFLQEAQPNREQMRLVAQALAGPALKGGELGSISPHAELSALTKLTANWKSVIEDAGLIPVETKAREAGQRRLFK